MKFANWLRQEGQGKVLATICGKRPGRAVFLWLVSVLLVAKAGAGPAYPLTASANGRYLVDSNNAPFLVVGDAPHSLIVNLSEDDAATYLINRGSNGVNTIWVELLCDGYTAGPGNEGAADYGHDLAGNNPFTGTLPGGYYDLTTPNERYWAHVDYIVQTAATNGIQCLLTPLDQGGCTTTSLVNGTNGCYQYGQFLGNRYLNSPNVFWLLGNDFQAWSTETNDAVILAIANGIKSVDTNHPMTVQLDFFVSDSLTDPNWSGVVSVNGVYTYYPTYDESLVGYNRPNYLPCLLLEANYEFEDNFRSQPSSPLVLRMQEYWSLLGGCLAGHLYGNYYTWTFFGDWRSNLDTTGMTQLMYFKNFFTNVAWYNLVPDQAHELITAGYGTYDSSSLHITANDYVTAAQTPDGTLGVAYCPTNATLTVCMTNFVGPVTARWLDPTCAKFITVSGSPFANTITATDLATPGNNSQGDPDWVLLLQASASATNSLGGTVSYYPAIYPSGGVPGTGVGGVAMNLTGGAALTTNTLADGTYSFNNLPIGGNYTVTPSKADDNLPSNNRGVDVVDLLAILDHYLGGPPLTSPYALLAADVNGDGIIDLGDLIEVQAMALGMANSFLAGLWRFVPADYDFSMDPTHPWLAPSSRSYNHLGANVTDGDFVAIKLGDVDGSWTGAQPAAAKGGQGMRAAAEAAVPDVVFRVSQQSGQSGRRVSVGVRVSGFSRVRGAQFTLAWDPAVSRYQGTGDYGLKGLSEGNFGTQLTESGKLTFVWYDPEAGGVTLADGTVLFTADFKIVGKGGSVSDVALADSPTPQKVVAAVGVVPFGRRMGR